MANKMLRLPYPASLEEQLKKCPGLKMSDIQMLREWCEKQRHLPKIPDEYLLLFLHANYNSMEAAKKTVENYFTMRTHIPEFFSNRDPFGTKDFRTALNVAAVFELPGKTKDGYRIFFSKLMNPDPAQFFLNESYKYFFMVADLIRLKRGPCDGFVFIGDATGLALGHVGRFTPMSLKKGLTYVQEGIPVRLKAVHLINTPPALDILLNIAKPFMKKELYDLIQLHPTLDSLEKYMSLDVLPNDVGGKAGQALEFQKQQIKELEDMRDWFLEEEQVFRVDESLRVGESKSASNLFGAEGSFKKLEID